MPDDGNFNSLIELIHARDTSSVDNIELSLGKYLDINNYLKYHALTSLLNNTDAFTNNFFMYNEAPGGHFKIIPWDYDKCFYKNDDVGLYGKNELITKLLMNRNIKQRYKTIIKELTNTIFKEDNIYPVIDSAAAVIKNAYNIDPYLGDGRYNFASEINDLKTYIKNRRTFFINNIDKL